MEDNREYTKYKALNRYIALLAIIYTVTNFVETFLWEIRLPGAFQFIDAILAGLFVAIYQWLINIPLLLTEMNYVASNDELGLRLILLVLQFSAAFFGVKICRYHASFKAELGDSGFPHTFHQSTNLDPRLKKGEDNK